MAIVDCVRSLAIENQESRKHSIDLVPGTCKWIKRHPIFQEWEGSHTDILWIRGQPGSGKSSLMGYLADTLDRENLHIANPMVISFFFHGAGSDVHRSLFGFYSVLLNQLLPEVPQFCHAIFEKYTQDRSRLGDSIRWQEKSLRDFLSAILFEATSAGIPIIILADALDEAGQSNAMELLKFFRSIENIAKDTTDGVDRCLKICFSCRPYPIVVGQNHKYIIDVDQHNKADLSMFIQNKLAPDPSVRIENDVLGNLQDEITRKTGRTFQWANLMIKEVRRMLTEMDPISDIREQISKTPSDLHQLYRQLVLPTIHHDSGNTNHLLKKQSLTLKLFQWLCFSKAPLTLATIQHALILGPDEPDIAESKMHRDFQPLEVMAVRVIELSRGLVEIRSQSWGGEDSESIVQFTHQSVYDFLLETGLADLSGSGMAGLELTARAMKVTGLGHFQISRACIQAMTMDESRSFIEAHRPLIGNKPQINQHYFQNPPDGQEMEPFKLSDCCYSFGLYATMKYTKRKLTVDEISARISQQTSDPDGDLLDLRQSLLQHSKQMNPVALYSSEHLCYHLETAEKRGWDQSDLLDLFNGTNLLSTWQGIVRLKLRERESDHDCLMAASSITHILAGWGITSALRNSLRQDPRSCSIQDEGGRTPLHYAIKYGRSKTIKLLMQEALELGCINVDQSDIHGNTPLHFAIEYGRENVAQTLIREALKHGTVNINHSNTHHGWTSLHYAIIHHRREIAQTLIRGALDGHFADVDYPDYRGWAPIFYAVRHNKIDEVRHLLQTGMVNMKREDLVGDTALMVALGRGCTEVASLLLKYGAPVESKNNSGQTPLLSAIRKSGMEMIKYLVEEASATVDLFDNEGRGVLSHAAQRGDLLITEYVFDIVPAQLEMADKEGDLPIEHARGKGVFDFLKTRMGRREEVLIKLARCGQRRAVGRMLKEELVFGLEILEQVSQAAREFEGWVGNLSWDIEERKEKEGKVTGKVEEIKQLMKERKRNRS